MKHLKIFENRFSPEMAAGMTSLGFDSFPGYFITYEVITGNGEGGATALAIVGESNQKVYKMIFDHFGIDPEEIEDEIKNLKSLDDVFDLVDENLSDLGSYLASFTTKVIEMKPIKLENSIQVEDLIDLPAVIKMGKRVFSDFDSKMQSS
jgi:hypothetical protein